MFIKNFNIDEEDDDIAWEDYVKNNLTNKKEIKNLVFIKDKKIDKTEDDFFLDSQNDLPPKKEHNYHQYDNYKKFIDENFNRRFNRKLNNIYIDDTLDLHGYKYNQAHFTLNSFIINSHKKNYKHLLIITGKGLNNKNNTYDHYKPGILRQYVPIWLKNDIQLMHLIYKVYQAPINLGGDGAYIIITKI